MGGTYTEAQKRATERYLAEKTESIQIRVPKGVKAIWREKARRSGMSLNRLIATLIARYDPEEKKETDQQ